MVRMFWTSVNHSVIQAAERYSGLRNSLRKLSNQTNLLLPPNASSVSTDCQIAWPDGQKKKTSVMTICGATRR